MRKFKLSRFGFCCLLLAIVLSCGNVFGEPPEWCVKIETTSGLLRNTNFSSGALVDPQWVLTTGHTLPVRGRREIVIHFSNGDEVTGDIMFRNVLLDIALVKLQKPRYEKTIPIGAQAPSGEEVNIHGFPAGGDYKVVSGEVFRFGRFVVKVAIDDGVSGGPVEVNGELVGVVSTVAQIGIQSQCCDVTLIKPFLRNIE